MRNEEFLKYLKNVTSQTNPWSRTRRFGKKERVRVTVRQSYLPIFIFSISHIITPILKSCSETIMLGVHIVKRFGCFWKRKKFLTMSRRSQCFATVKKKNGTRRRSAIVECFLRFVWTTKSSRYVFFCVCMYVTYFIIFTESHFSLSLSLSIGIRRHFANSRKYIWSITKINNGSKSKTTSKS